MYNYPIRAPKTTTLCVFLPDSKAEFTSVGLWSSVGIGWTYACLQPVAQGKGRQGHTCACQYRSELARALPIKGLVREVISQLIMTGPCFFEIIDDTGMLHGHRIFFGH